MCQLIKYELQKLMGRKIVWAALAGMLFMVCAMSVNWIYPDGESVQYFQDGEFVSLDGKEAIREAQAAAEKYAGPLTDERVQSVLRDFDMPDEEMRANGMEPAREGYYVHNPLYASLRDFQNMDGSWNGVTVRELYGDLADRLTLGYSTGWVSAIYAVIYTLLSLGCVLIIILAPLFADEYTRGMDALILTGTLGRTKCAWAKIIAAFLVSIGLFAAVSLGMLALYLITHGVAGWNASIQINDLALFAELPYPMTCGQAVLYAILLWFTAGLVVAAVSVLISAAARSSFVSLIISFVVFVLPLFITWNKMGILNMPAQFLPIRQMQLMDMFELPLIRTGAAEWNVMWLTVPVSLLAAALCGMGARKVFARHQVM